MNQPSSHAVRDAGARLRKAEKARRLLEGALAGRSTLRLLDVGTGSGALAHFFASREPRVGCVVAVDVSDQRSVTEGFRFERYDGTHLPFPDASFDLVVSNHVIEHVGGRRSQLRHLQEIARVLAPAGTAYVATPSRWQFLEPHFRLPGLSWLPPRWRSAYVRVAGRGAGYDCNPLSPGEIEALLGRAGLAFVNRNVDALAVLVQVEDAAGSVAGLLSRLPARVLRGLRRLSPAMIYTCGRSSGHRDGR